MKLLITGSNGFLGKALCDNLEKLNTIFTLSRKKAYFNCNLENEIPIFDSSFDVIIHAAGKAHMVPKSIKESMSFFAINFDGTKNLCKALENNLPKAFIFISTVAVYGIEFGENINETQELKGSTPYALSKIKAEEFVQDWCERNKVKLGILRPSLIAGKNPPGNLGAMIKAIKTGKYFRIGDGNARKSILMAEDIARLLPKLIEKGGTYNLCDSNHPSFYELEVLIAKQLKRKSPKSIPLWLAKIIALVGDLIGSKAPINSFKLQKITNSLTFSNEKAKRELQWEPLDVLENFVIE